VESEEKGEEEDTGGRILDVEAGTSSQALEVRRPSEA
jgi:hypothetical protein